MEGKQSEVVLFGTWASPYCTRIKLALKVKGITYDYVEENIANKSQLLLDYNPVHKKVPVLVHKGKPIAESLVILEYIDECWPNTPKLLPEDPYQRAKLRFWVQFHEDKIMRGGVPITRTKGEQEEKEIKELEEWIKVFEEGMKRDFPGKFPFFNGDQELGLLDIIVGSNACKYEAIDVVFSDIIITKPKMNPDFFSWVSFLKDHPVIKETLPPLEKMVALLKDVLAFSQTTPKASP